MKNMENKTFISAMIISIGIFLSRITGLLRDIIFASFLGTGFLSEVFYVAFRLPNTFRRIFAEGAFSNAFVPFFSSKIKENSLVANVFSSKIMLILLFCLSVLTIFIEIFMPQVISIINPGFLADREKFLITVFLSRITFPYVILISMAAFFGSILNSVGSFWQFSIISVILNIVLSFGLIFTKKLFSNVGECLSYLLIVAGIFQVIFVIFFCLKKKIFPSKIFIKNLDEKISEENNKDVKLFIKKFFSAIISSGILQINIFIDGIFASFFSGAISYLYYTDRLIQFPLSIIGYSLSVAILPALSIAFKEKNFSKIAVLQKDSLNIAMFFSIPAMLMIYALSEYIVSLVYEHGVFKESDTEIVALMTSIYAFSIPFNVLLKIFFSCFYAQKNTKYPMKISFFSLLFNIISNIIFINILGMYCVIFSTTLSAVFSFVLAIFLLKKNSIFFIEIKDLFFSLKVLFISALSCSLSLFLCNKMPLIFVLFISGCFHFIMCFFVKILSIEKVSSWYKKMAE